MYTLFCEKWGMDVMYAISDKNKIKIDSKQFKRFEPDPSKIKFKFCWVDEEISDFITAAAEIFRESPRFYDGVILWYAGRGSPGEDQLIQFYDSNGDYAASRIDAEQSFVQKECHLLPRIYFFDIRMGELESEPKFEEGKKIEADMKAVIDQGKQDMKMDDEQYQIKKKILRKPTEKTEVGDAVNASALMTFTSNEIGSTEDGGSKLVEAIITKFSDAKENEEELALLLNSTEDHYMNQFNADQHRNLKILVFTNYLFRNAYLE